MAINLSDNLLSKTTAPGDAKYGPYTGANLSTALIAATTSLLPSYRYKGLTIGIIVSTDPIVEYWFENGVTDGNLVPKGGSYLTASALVPYLTTASASATYYSLTNPSAYITASALVPYLTTASASTPFYNKGGLTYSFDTTTSIYRTGSLSIGTGSVDSNDRFVVSSSGGTISLVVDEFGNVYNRGNGGIPTNTAFGTGALSLNLGYQNTAIGVNALLSNTIANDNTAIGNSTLSINTTGFKNTAIGASALSLNSIAYQNTAIGVSALLSNTTGNHNTAIGSNALIRNISGHYNIALGVDAGKLISNSGTGVTNSNNSIFIGYDTRPSLDSNINEIVIGHGATGNGSNSVTLGNNDITRTYLKGKVVIADGTEAVGRVLTCDATGLSSWTPITTGTVTNATGTFPISVATNTTTPVISVADAGTASSGVITTGTQTIAGTKTFTSDVTINNASGLGNINISSNGGIGSGVVFNNLSAVTTGTILSNIAFVQFNAYNSAGYLFKNSSGSNVLSIDQAGTTIFLGLTGSGTRMVVASSTGQLSTQAIPTAGTGTVTNVSGTFPISVATNTTTPVISVANASGTQSGVITNVSQTIGGFKTFTSPVTVGDTTTVLYSSINQNSIDIHNGNDTTIGWIRHESNGFTRYKGSVLTNFVVVDPIASTIINLPAKPAGMYTIAMLEDITSGTVTNVSGTFPISVATGASTPVISVANASATQSGVITNGSQTIGGLKTFNSDIEIDSSTTPKILFQISNSGTGTISSSTSVFQFDAFNSSGYLFRNGTGSNILSIDQVGTTVFLGSVTATAFFNSSDARLKDVIERDGDTVKFTWKDKRDDKLHIGYIAQEVQEKYPNQVNKNSDGMLTVNYIEVLVAKIQELENRIKKLEK